MRHVPGTAAAVPVVCALGADPLAAQTLERMAATGEIRIGHRIDALPLSFVDDAGVPSGHSVEVCAAVAERIGLALGLDRLIGIFTAVTPEEQFEAVAGGEIDLLCAAATVTLERREIVDFSIPTFIDGAAVLLNAGGLAPSALAEGRIGVRAGSTTEEALAGQLADRGLRGEIRSFDSHQAGRDALMGDAIDAYVGDQSILIGLILTSGAPETLTLAEEMLTIEKHALALKRGDSDFRLAVDRALSELYAEGRMAEILAETLPGVEPGLALRALQLIAPELP